MNWVIGDIHGMLRPLRALVDRVRRADPGAALLFVGDYINRGPDSKGVIDFLLALDGARFCRGNHDDIFRIVRLQKDAGRFASDDEAAAFALGLKLLGEAVLRNRDDPLLQQLKAPLRDFIGALKAQNAERPDSGD